MIGAEERALRMTLTETPELSLRGCQPSEHTWREHANHLRNDLLTNDPNTFLRLWVVRHTMYTVGHPEWATPMLSYLRGLDDWETRWKPALIEPDVGKPSWYGDAPYTSETAISFAYVLAKFEESAERRIETFPAVFEFGSSYGGMCRLIHSLGFGGEYIAYDFPVLLALMRYYLRKCDLGGIVLLSGSTTEFLDAMLDGAAEGALFISTWALSEAPLSLRKRFKPDIDPFGAHLLTYQNEFHEMDNADYFLYWTERRPQFDWYTWTLSGNEDSHGITGIRHD